MRDDLQLIALNVREARVSDVLDLETRFSTITETGELEGWATRFNVVDSYRTSFDQRAFATSAGESIPMLWAHDQSQVVGSVRSVSVEPEGLRIKGRLNLDVAKAREVRALLVAGDIGGLSIGFQRLKDEARSGGVRHITSARLREVSFVAIPSVPGSNITHVRQHQRDEALAEFNRAIARTTAAIGKRN